MDVSPTPAAGPIRPAAAGAQLSLVLPCYREAEHIETSVPRILRVLADLPYSTEIIFVDDASPDDTVARLEAICDTYAAWPMRLVRHPTNRGRGAAVTTGFRAASGRWVGYIDVDLEVAPDYIAACCRVLDEGWDVCIGSRFYPATLTSLPRFLASTIYRRLAWRALGLPEIDSESGYKFFVRERVLPLLDRTTSPGWFWDTEIVAESFLAGLRVAQTPCLHLRRLDKTSTVRLMRDTVSFLRELLRYRARLAARQARRRPVPAPATVRPTFSSGARPRPLAAGLPDYAGAEPAHGAAAGALDLLGGGSMDAPREAAVVNGQPAASYVSLAHGLPHLGRSGRGDSARRRGE